MAPVVPIVMAIGAKIAAGAAAAKAAVAATAIGSKVIAGVTAVKGAIGAATTAVKGLAVVGKVGGALGKVGTAIKATKVGGAVAKGIAAVGKTKIGGALFKGAKVVSGFAKAHPVVTNLGQTAVQQGVQSMANAQQQGNSVVDTALTIDSEAESSKDIAGQNARATSYQDSVFGSAMNISNNQLAGDGPGAGLFSGLLKQKRHSLT
jgi:hypothetical protein